MGPTLGKHASIGALLAAVLAGPVGTASANSAVDRLFEQCARNLQRSADEIGIRCNHYLQFAGDDDAARRRQALPDGRRLAQPARPQFQPDQRRERPLGRPAGGPAPPDRLPQGVGGRQVRGGGLVRHGLHPALDQRQGGAQAGEARIRDVVEAGGLTRFRRAAETPFNIVYEAGR